MRDAEVHAAASAEHLVVNAARDRIGVALRARMPFGIRDAHLHRAAGANRIQAAEQTFAERHPADEVRKDVTQLRLGLHRLQPLPIALAIRRLHAQRRIHQELRNLVARRSCIDLTTGDGGQPGHGRSGVERRFLLGDRDHAANVLRRRADRQRFEGRENVDGPTFAILDCGENALGNFRPRHIRIDGWLAHRRTPATGDHAHAQCHRDCAEPAATNGVEP